MTRSAAALGWQIPCSRFPPERLWWRVYSCPWIRPANPGPIHNLQTGQWSWRGIAFDKSMSWRWVWKWLSFRVPWYVMSPVLWKSCKNFQYLSLTLWKPRWCQSALRSLSRSCLRVLPWRFLFRFGLNCFHWPRTFEGSIQNLET